jgi:tight adherence protein B
MNPMILILVASGGAVTALVFGVANFLQSKRASQAESRLAAFTGNSATPGGKIAEGIVHDGMSSASGIAGKMLKHFQNLPRFFEQAESPLKLEQFLIVCAATSAAGALFTVLIRTPPAMLPLGVAGGFSCPWIWLWWRRRRRFMKFESQLAGALELMARALRSGHSLGSGLQVVANEMPNPIAKEFLKKPTWEFQPNKR